MLSGGDSDSSRQCLHSKTDNSTAGANVYGSVCECVCVEKRESLLLTSLPRSVLRSFSLPSLAPFLLPALWLLSPFLLYTFFLSSLLALSVSLFLFLSLPSLLSSPSPPLSPSLYLSPPLSFSSRASLLAVDVTEAEAEATLPLIGCHSQVSDKEKGREKNETKKHGGGGSGGGGREKILPLHPSEHQLTVE